MVKPASSPDEGAVLLAKLAKYYDGDDDGGDDGGVDGNNDDLDLVPGGSGCSPCQAPTGSCSSSSATTPRIISISISCHHPCCDIIRSVEAWKIVSLVTHCQRVNARDWRGMGNIGYVSK